MIVPKAQVMTITRPRYTMSIPRDLATGAIIGAIMSIAAVASMNIPMIMNRHLWETSGHWDHYKDGMFVLNDTEEAEKSGKVIDTAKLYIQKNYMKDISLDEVSREVNISPYYFSKLFKDETGEGFVEYITNMRIEKAKELMAEGDYTMKEICQMVGYTDPNYFSRAFKKNVGVTPTEYKENL